jgi:two-component system NarL family sensor kinase
MYLGFGKESDSTSKSDGGRTTIEIAWAGALISLAVVSVALVFAVYLMVVSPDSLLPPPHILFSPITTFAFSITGAFIASRQPKNPIGWLFELVGFFSALILMSTTYYGMSKVTILPESQISVWLQAWVWIPTIIIPFSVLLLLFPDGRLLSNRWLPFFLLAVVGLVLVLIAVGFNPDPGLQQSIDLPEPNPFGVSGAGDILTTMLYLGGAMIIVAVLGSVISVVVRFRRSNGVSRTQMKWLAYAGFFVIVAIILSSLLAGIFPDEPNIEELTIIIVDLAVSGIAIATGIAIIRYGLYDINLLINRTVVYGTLTLVIIGAYILIVGVVSTFIQSMGTLVVSFIATGVIAVSFQPFRERLQRGVNHMMYGERDEPYAVISRLGRRLEATLAPESVLPTITMTVAQALKLPYVAISLREDDGFRIVFSTGERTEEQYILPLKYQAEEIGGLICGYRSPGESFSDSEKNLLQDVANQASIAIHAIRLTHDLRRARRQLVQSREEERRRIRRDLHDGLGPILASHRLKIGSAYELFERNPAGAQALIKETEAGLTTAIEEIRRLVYDLRPPALDELGLVQAIKQSAPQTPNLEITFKVPAKLPELPAAVDVAAYRIVQEALSNTIHHSQASRVSVSLQVNEIFEISIHDNGTGLPEDYMLGVGLTSMRERAEELGGTFELVSGKTGGTWVIVRLPLEDSEL